jgi:hypothetical protein
MRRINYIEFDSMEEYEKSEFFVTNNWEENWTKAGRPPLWVKIGKYKGYTLWADQGYEKLRLDLNEMIVDVSNNIVRHEDIIGIWGYKGYSPTLFKKVIFEKENLT